MVNKEYMWLLWN